ncbi:tyrosine-type recombinase/integrase [Alkalibacillus aidingensis]|uniref:tyrosine-type recombinase/integrase n=1 Tax=Alkalibacillus aidingensis TaxID=2747607 RepID=UPI00374E0023
MKNPTSTVHTPREDDSLPYYLSKQQMVELKEASREHIKDRAIIETLYATGVRISELLNIRLEDEEVICLNNFMSPHFT